MEKLTKRELVTELLDLTRENENLRSKLEASGIKKSLDKLITLNKIWTDDGCDCPDCKEERAKNLKEKEKTFSADVVKELITAARSSKKIPAIKKTRELLGLGLKETKALVDEAWVVEEENRW